jgi:hypothetical protein
MNEPYYLYALSPPEPPADRLGPGVDPRFAVELVPAGPLAAAASRVGLDEFDPKKLQQGSADLPWLSKVAIRHNEIIAALAQRRAVLPMRLGTIFQSRDSLLARLKPYEPQAVDFLRGLGDRQEWAAKLYIETDPRQRTPQGGQSHFHGDNTGVRGGDADAVKIGTVPTAGGAAYLAAQGLRLRRRRQVETAAKTAAATLEDRLGRLADSWRRLRVLPHVFSNRPEQMVSNAAFLLSRSKLDAFQAGGEQLRRELAPQGLIVELSGPWPPYHFCPSFEPRDESSPCRCTC